MSKSFTRVQTRDKIVIVTDTFVKEDGDYDQSIRYYGPFNSADQQRNFMRKIIEGSPVTDEERQQEMLQAVDRWRRFDEGLPS